VVNLANRSWFCSPVLAFSLLSNLDLTLGAQFFGGSQGTEYQHFSDLYYAQLQWFF